MWIMKKKSEHWKIKNNKKQLNLVKEYVHIANKFGRLYPPRVADLPLTVVEPPHLPLCLHKNDK